MSPRLHAAPRWSSAGGEAGAVASDPVGFARDAGRVKLQFAGGQSASGDDSCLYMPSQDVPTIRRERAVTGEQRIRVRPIAVTKPQAAAALSISIDSFERYVQPDLRVIRRGRLRLFTVAELERWANENAQRTLP